jgi:threonylcarbamoyladenosine tRNA methylthiotransferase MtaB
MKKLKIGIATLGCKVNQYESALLAQQLYSKEYSIVPFGSVADIYIINTCTVTARADFQSRQLIRRALNNNMRAKIIVTGCYAQISPDDIPQSNGQIIILDNKQKNIIPQIIENDEDDLPFKSNKNISGTFDHVPLNKFMGHTRAFLKIQNGCDSYCSYCIIPYARGEKRSLPPEMAMNSINNFIAHGYREIVLTGIHLGAYGQDLSPKTNLSSLLEKITTVTSLEKRTTVTSAVRFRLSSIEPQEITGDILELLKINDIFCPHLHIPLQSGDDNILRLMKRNYDSSFYRNLIEKITTSLDNISIGVDVMVGFPGEGDNEFENTYRLLQNLPIAYLHVFPYSERPLTAASKLWPKIPDKIKKERALLLRELSAKKRETFASRFLSRRLLVLVEKSKDKKTGLFKGFSENYIPVLLKNGNNSSVNNIVPVLADKYDNGKLYGKIIS